MMFGMFGGFRLMNEIADEIGAERSVLKAALTEVGVNFALVKIEFNAVLMTSEDRRECLEEIAASLLEPAYRGLQIMAQKFPEETSIRRCQETLMSYAARKGLLGEEGKG